MLDLTDRITSRVQLTTRVTPAMAAGICDHVWEVEEMAKLVEERETAAIKRVSYNPRNSN